GAVPAMAAAVGARPGAQPQPFAGRAAVPGRDRVVAEPRSPALAAPARGPGPARRPPRLRLLPRDPPGPGHVGPRGGRCQGRRPLPEPGGAGADGAAGGGVPAPDAART